MQSTQSVENIKKVQKTSFPFNRIIIVAKRSVFLCLHVIGSLKQDTLRNDRTASDS